MLLKLKRSIGVISSKEYSAIIAVKHFNDLIDKYYELTEKFFKVPDGMKRDTIDSLIGGVLLSITDHATTLAVFKDDPEFSRYFDRALSNVKEKSLIECEVNGRLVLRFDHPSANNFMQDLTGDDHFVRESDMKIRMQLVEVYKWVKKTFNPAVHDKMYVRSFVSLICNIIEDNNSKSVIDFKNKMLALTIEYISKIVEAQENAISAPEVRYDFNNLNREFVTALAVINPPVGQQYLKIPYLTSMTNKLGLIEMLDKLNRSLVKSAAAA